MHSVGAASLLFASGASGHDRRSRALMNRRGRNGSRRSTCHHGSSWCSPLTRRSSFTSRNVARSSCSSLDAKALRIVVTAPPVRLRDECGTRIMASQRTGPTPRHDSSERWPHLSSAERRARTVGASLPDVGPSRHRHGRRLGPDGGRRTGAGVTPRARCAGGRRHVQLLSSVLHVETAPIGADARARSMSPAPG